MEVVCKDAIEYLNSFNDESFDLIILDPDYQDWEKLLEQGLIELSIRKLKGTGNIICFTKQPFDFVLRTYVNPYFRREIVWSFDNGGAWCSPKMPLVSTQKLYWLVKGKQFYFNPRTGVPYSENTKNFKRCKKVFGDYEADGRQFVKSEDGIWIRDHLHYNKPNCGKIPAKPKQLIEIILRCFCQGGGSVCDPFAGSGIIPLMAEQMGLDAFACDTDENRVMQILDKYFEDCETKTSTT